jgi:hypothetical protein
MNLRSTDALTARLEIVDLLIAFIRGFIEEDSLIQLGTFEIVFPP